MSHVDHRPEVRALLNNPRSLCEKLGLLKGSKGQTGGGVSILCPNHSEKTPSCSVSMGDDGTVRVWCFGCQWGGDALALVGVALGIDQRSNFRELLAEAARIGGDLALADEIKTGTSASEPREPKPQQPAPDPGPPRDYPPQAEVDELWDYCGRVDDCGPAVAHLTARGLCPESVTRLDLARALTGSQRLPRWACYGEQDWRRSGHRMLVPMWDAAGVLRSVRAWRVEGDSPAKRLPPRGHKATGLVFANRMGLRLLRDECAPQTILVAEGEPDAIVASTRWVTSAVFGIVSGSWNDSFAARVPRGSRVVIMVHHDEAGEKYAQQIKSTVSSRAQVARSKAI